MKIKTISLKNLNIDYLQSKEDSNVIPNHQELNFKFDNNSF